MFIIFSFFGFPFLFLFFYFLRPDPPPATRYPSPATRHPPPATRHPRKSPGVKKWVILIAFRSRYSFVTHSIDRKPRDWGLARSAYSPFFYSAPRVWVALRSPFGRRSVRQRGYGLRLLIFKMANNEVDLGQIRSEEIVYSRFIKIPFRAN